ncbi:ABC transporter permease [Elusimicrobiota bacterium]
MHINPLTLKKIKRFRSIKRGYYSFIILSLLILACACAEMLVNNRALLVQYNENLYFPTYGSIHTGKDFGLDYEYEVDYKSLKKKFRQENKGDFVIMPPVPYNAYENDLKEDGMSFPPYPPSTKEKHYLGTDNTGRDILARLFYGFRTAIAFAILVLIFEYMIGVTIGCLMGFLGGRFDLYFQRVIEIWVNIPKLYAIIIVSSIMVPTFGSLAGIMIFFGWTTITWYMRTSTYKEKTREYVMAARALGASNLRIIFVHILPNAIAVLVTFIPFSVSGSIIILTSLDYLGFGLPAPTPSWGELLRQGTENLSALWIASSVVASMVAVLLLVNFIGEAVREAFDPKKHTVYE